MTTIFILTFIVILFLLVYVRVRSESKYEVKITDIVVALIPVALWLLLSGRLIEFGVGDLKVKLQEAYKAPIAKQVNLKDTALIEKQDFVYAPLYCRSKATDEIPLLEFKTPEFIVVIENCEEEENGQGKPKFVGLLTEVDFRRYNLQGFTMQEWARAKRFDEIKSIFPSFVSYEHAVSLETSKLEALELMDSLNVGALPVIDSEKHFIGVINRSRLTTSFLTDVGKALK